MRWAAVALLLVGALAGADPLAAEYGPRVNLELTDQPLADVVDAVGRQINRRLEGSFLQQAPGRKPVDLVLHDATVAQALASIEELAECRALRRSRERYVLQPQRELPGFVGQPLGDWHLWLESVQYTLSSIIYPADPTRRWARVSTCAQFRLDAPSDADSVRLRRLRQPGLPAADPARQSRFADVTAPDPNDNRQWRLQLWLPVPGPDETSIERGEFTGEFASSCRQVKFDFGDLGSEETLLQTDGDLDVQLEAPQTRRGPLWRVSLFLPPPAVEPNQSAPRPTPPWVEFWLRDRDAQPLYVDSRAEGSTLEQDRLVWRYLVQPNDPEAAGGATLTVEVTLPEGESEAVPIRFEQIPMPDRREPDFLER